MRVPLAQSSTRSAARASATSGSRVRSGPVGRQGREVVGARDLVRAVADAVGLAVGGRRLAPGGRVAAGALCVLGERAGVDVGAGRGADRPAREPRLEGAVEGLEVLAPG